MTISEKGLSLIKSFESLRLKAYFDGGKVPTIGYGTTKYPGNKPVKMGDIITKELAEVYLKDHIQNKVINELKTLLPNDVLTNQDKVDSLISFIYNIGINAFKTSTLLKKINEGADDKEIVTQFKRWNKDNGKVIDGLAKRRVSEYTLYTTGKLILNK